MCVAQFRDYCNAFKFKVKENITKNDEIQHKRGTFYGHSSHRAYWYTKNKSTMRALAKQGNPYAIKEI